MQRVQGIMFSTCLGVQVEEARFCVGSGLAITFAGRVQGFCCKVWDICSSDKVRMLRKGC